MISTATRIIFIIALLISMGWAIYIHQYELAAVAALLAVLVIRSHFKDGTVALAAKAFKNGQLEKAEALLAEIKNPDYLRRRRRGYYEFILANIALQNKNFESAETHFQIATRFPFSSENDKGIVLMHLANINLRKKDYTRVRAYIDRAKDLRTGQRVQSIIQKIEKEIPQIS